MIWMVVFLAVVGVVIFFRYLKKGLIFRLLWLQGVLLLGASLSCGESSDSGGIRKGPTDAVRMRILERTSKPLLVSDRPWEEFTLNYLTVIREGELWRMWYAAYDPDYEYDCDAYLCYAVSQDGIHWEKPELDLVPWKDGQVKTNILMDGRSMRANTTTVFRDDEAPSEERYKALLQKFLGRDEKGRGVWHNYAAVSPDGLQWNLLPESIYPGTAILRTSFSKTATTIVSMPDCGGARTRRGTRSSPPRPRTRPSGP